VVLVSSVEFFTPSYFVGLCCEELANVTDEPLKAKHEVGAFGLGSWARKHACSSCKFSGGLPYAPISTHACSPLCDALQVLNLAMLQGNNLRLAIHG